MTDQQKDELIGKMVDCPETLTPQEMEAIEADRELREIYEASERIAGAYASRIDADAEAAWRELRPRLAIRRRSWIGWSTGAAAAALLGLVVASGLRGRQEPLVADADMPREEEATDTVVYEPVMPVEIEDVVAEAQPVLPSRPKLAAQSVATIDSVESAALMRVAQARIDNDEAMVMAEVYLSDYTVMKEMMQYQGIDLTEEMDFNINQLIMP